MTCVIARFQAISFHVLGTGLKGEMSLSQESANGANIVITLFDVSVSISFYDLILLLMGQYCFACGRRQSSVTLPAGGPASRRVHGWSAR